MRHECMKTTGYFKIWRGIWKEAEKPFTSFMAWMWMVSEAEYEEGPLHGCVIASLSTLKEEWGWKTRRQVQWQLEKWKKDERIELVELSNHVQKACSTACSLRSPKRAVQRAVARAIKLVNYDTYQSGKLESRAVQRATERAVSVQNNVQKACSNTSQASSQSEEQSPKLNNKVQLNNIREEYRGTIKYATKKLSTDLSTGEASGSQHENHPDDLKAETKKKDPRIEQMIAHFKEDYFRVFQTPAIVNIGAATTQLKRLFDAGYDYDEIKRRMHLFNRDELKWMKGPKSWSIPIFVSVFDHYDRINDKPSPRTQNTLPPEPEDQASSQDQAIDSALDQLPEDERQEIYQQAETQALQSPMRRFKDNPSAWTGAIQAEARIIYQERYE
jgi:hypothetical protein